MNARLLLVIPPLALSASAFAQTGSDTPLEPLFTCRDIVEDSARLACLDAAVDALRAGTASGEVVAVDRQQIEAAEEATWGLDIPGFRMPGMPGFSLGGDDAELAAVDAADASPDRVVTRRDDGSIERIEQIVVTGLTTTRSGDAEVTLANGQVWRQTDGTHVQGLRRGATDGLTASIRSGALGSFFMRLDNGGRWFRAERVQ